MTEANPLRSRERITLPDGQQIEARKPRVMDCIRAGGIPLGILAALEAKGITSGDEQAAAAAMSAEETQAVMTLNDTYVKLAVAAVLNGDETYHDVELTDRDLLDMSQANYDFLLAYARREAGGSGN